MTTRSIALFGATGLVGQHCLRLLLDRPEFVRIVVGVRSTVQLDLSPAQRAKLELHVIDFERLPNHAELFAVDQILCALGTTIRKAGSQRAFRIVDFVYPEQIARLGVERGARHFLLVSAVGANARSAVFYNRVKGELEDAVRSLPYRAHTIVRPSLLLGERTEFRLGEKIAGRLGFLVPRKYQPVHARDVARALVEAAVADRPGVNVIESQDIERVTAK
jgi:uncharacterized protein YbjT (DUF2867 family)